MIHPDCFPDVVRMDSLFETEMDVFGKTLNVPIDMEPEKRIDAVVESKAKKKNAEKMKKSKSLIMPADVEKRKAEDEWLPEFEDAMAEGKAKKKKQDVENKGKAEKKTAILPKEEKKPEKVEGNKPEKIEGKKPEKIEGKKPEKVEEKVIVPEARLPEVKVKKLSNDVEIVLPKPPSVCYTVHIVYPE